MRIWEIYPALTNAIKVSHDAASAEILAKTGTSMPMFHCHDFDHALRVGNLAHQFADDESVGRLAGIAGLCHNADRILQALRGFGPFGRIPDEDIVGMTEVWLAAEPAWMFTTLQRMLIMDAVLHHGKRNGQDDSPVLVALQDADRVVNIGGDIAFRKGQFCGNALRVVDPVHLLHDPAANFKNPGSIAWTLHDDIVCFGAEDGVASLRTSKGRAFAKRRLAAARAFLDELLAQREEEGLIPFPTFD